MPPDSPPTSVPRFFTAAYMAGCILLLPTAVVLHSCTLACVCFCLSRVQLDWQAGRMVLTADGRFALRPSWFEKYRDDPKTAPGRTIVLFSSDRSAVNSGSDAAQQQRGFPQAFWGMTGSISYAGYTNYLSRSFPAGASPGVAMARHLLADGTAGNFTGTGAVDQRTGAVFKSYAFRPAATLTDRCDGCGEWLRYLA